MTQREKVFTVVGWVLLAILVVWVVELLSNVAYLKLNHAYLNQLGVGSGPSPSLELLAKTATFAERFSFVLYFPAVLLAIALGARRVRATSVRMP